MGALDPLIRDEVSQRPAISDVEHGARIGQHLLAQDRQRPCHGVQLPDRTSRVLLVLDRGGTNRAEGDGGDGANDLPFPERRLRYRGPVNQDLRRRRL